MTVTGVIPLAMRQSPAAMAVRAMRLANACEARGDMGGMFRNLERVSQFMALPSYSYDEFVGLGGLAADIDVCPPGVYN